ncbi:hypothetical protein AAOE16_17475 [Ekhidna sp. MALMAid0563]|uniref:hypothetical protein n=1 Tax=Ekhidna sp. MALMAid0563 TaxID=3143937 RepID=UPI0032DF8F56
MRVDIKDDKEFTIDSVRELTKTVDDSETTQFRVTTDGFLILENIDHNKEHVGILFRLEPNGAYNGYAGPKAAADNSWIQRIYNVVRKNWPNPESPYIDIF